MTNYMDWYGPFADSFSKQLQEISKNISQKTLVRFTLKLPWNNRFRYTEFDYIYVEVSRALRERYPIGCEIINLIPNANDDHFIEVTLRVNIV